MIAERIKAIAEGMRDPRRRKFQYNTMHDLVLRQGMPFRNQPLPAHLGKMKPGLCYHNALMLMMHDRHLTYCEGYAIPRHKTDIPVMHAWCSDEQGNVVDPTWPYTKGRQYMGIPFNRLYVLTTALDRNASGSLIDDWENNWPLLRRFRPGIKADIEAAAGTPTMARARTTQTGKKKDLHHPASRPYASPSGPHTP